MSDTSTRHSNSDAAPHGLGSVGEHPSGLNSVDILQGNMTQKYIGDATMDKDGVITLHMRQTADGMQTNANLKYKPDSKDYDQVFCHLGGIKPGETKMVKPFDDESQAGDKPGAKQDCPALKKEKPQATKW